MATTPGEGRDARQHADLCHDFPDWRIRRERDGHGQTTCWNATLSAGGRSAILAANGPEELRQRLRQATEKSADA